MNFVLKTFLNMHKSIHIQMLTLRPTATISRSDKSSVSRIKPGHWLVIKSWQMSLSFSVISQSKVDNIFNIFGVFLFVFWLVFVFEFEDGWSFFSSSGISGLFPSMISGLNRMRNTL